MRVLFIVGLLASFAFATGARAEDAPPPQSPKAAMNEQMRAKMEADTQKCHDTQFPTHRAAAQCMNEAMMRPMMAANYPYMDMVQLVAAYRVACAQKMDAGELSEDSCNKRLSDLRQRVAAEEARRRNPPPAAAIPAPAAKPGAKPGANPVAKPVASRKPGLGPLLKGLATWSASDDNVAVKPGQIICMQRDPVITCY
jgi:hypothetical protein